jgi:serine/threonine-protein kinase
MYRIGDAVGDYRVVGVVGTGGAGEVYRVEHTITKRIEALKVLMRDRPDLQEQSQRFLHEIQVQASLSHPHIASVLTAFRAGSELMMVMELVEGRPLDRILEEGRLPLERAVDFTRQALSALACAHANGIIHRDIKPSNMIISPAGVLKLTDFGLARTVADTKVTQTGEVVGSLHYISPEQVKSEREADHRTDIYSMGAVLYEMATGSKPFPSDNAFSLMLAHVQEKPKPPHEVDAVVPRELSAAILKAMAKKPADRFQTAEEFLAAIEPAAPKQDQSTRRVPLSVWLGGAALVAVALIAAIIGARTWTSRRLADVAVLELRKPETPSVPATDERVGPPREVIAVEVTADSKTAAVTPEFKTTPESRPVQNAIPGAGPSSVPASPTTAPATPERASSEARGAIRVLGAIPAGRTATAIAISPNGRWAGIGTSQGVVELWDMRSSRHTSVVGHAGAVTAVGFSRDGESMATGGTDGSVKVWDLQERRDRTTFGHPSSVSSVAFAADGKWLATGSSDRKIRLWSLREKGVVNELPDVRREPRALLVSPAGDTLASLSLDKTLRLWNVAGAGPQRRLNGPERGSSLGAFSADGRYLAVASPDEVQILDLSTGAQLERHRIGPRAVTLSFAPDGSCVALFQTLDGIAVIDAWNGQVIHSTGRDRGVSQAVFRPDGRELLMVGDGGGVAVWQELPAGRHRKPR